MFCLSVSVTNLNRGCDWLCIAFVCAFLTAHAEPLPKGYSAIKAAAQKLQAAESVYQIGDFALPETIMARREQLLVAPIELHIDSDSHLIAKPKLVSKGKGSAKWSWNA